MVNMSPQVPLILGAEGAVGTAEGWSLATFVQQMSLQDIRVLVALSTARAVVSPIKGDPHTSDRSVIVVVAVIIIVIPGAVARWTVQPGAALRSQGRRHVIGGHAGAVSNSARAPTEARQETCGQSKQMVRRID